MRYGALIVGAALLAASCGKPKPEQNAVKEPVRSEGQRQLHSLNDYNRAIGLKRAIHSSGLQCYRIDRSAFVQRYGTLDMWAAACNNGRGYALFVGRDDSVQVRGCKSLAELKLPRCPPWAEDAKVSR